MERRRIFFLILVSVVILLVVACGNQVTVEPQNPAPPTSDVDTPAEEPADTPADLPEDAPAEFAADAETLLNDRCGVCHSIDLVNNKALSPEEWVSTIDRMIQKGADLSDTERDILATFLAETAGR